MMRSIIKHLFFITIIFIYISGFSQEENRDAVFLEMTKAYTLNEGGSWDYNEIKKVKLLTYYSFHRLYGETFIVHDPGFQDLKINEAYTIMADGKKVPTPENAFNLVLPRFAAKAPPYNRFREMVVTHTGLENGAIIKSPSYLGRNVILEEGVSVGPEVVIDRNARICRNTKVEKCVVLPDVTLESDLTLKYKIIL